MRKKLPTIIVTGGAGFIGSEFVRQAVKKGHRIVIIDSLTYAGDLRRLRAASGKYKFYRCDIRNKKRVDGVFRKERPRIIIHFAAETHVDRSIEDATPFIETNIKGTQILLDAARKYHVKKFIHISTDEIYGELTSRRGHFTELSPMAANSPYAVSKAAADMLVQAYYRTYGLPVVIVRPSNNYGPWQYPEKLIPQSVARALAHKHIPVYGKGKNIREWLYVADCARAILLLMKKGKTGEAYNLGSGQEKRNIEVVTMLCTLLDQLRPMQRGTKRRKQKSHKAFIAFVTDRLGHDFRYCLNSQKIRSTLQWRPSVSFSKGLEETVRWHVAQRSRA